MPYRALILTSLAFTLCGACLQSEADACGKGAVYRDGACHPADTVGARAPTEGGAAGDAFGAAGENSAGATATTDPNFGLACADSDECAGATNYCVPKSPFDDPYCSASGCDADASICPEGWTCFDLSRFLPGEPWACSRPTN